jgi:hypothetical protein
VDGRDTPGHDGIVTHRVQMLSNQLVRTARR